MERDVIVSRAKYDITPENKDIHKGKAVMCITTGEVFKSAREAANYYGFFEHYKEQDAGNTKESALMSQIALLLLNYGPKVDEALNDNEAELFDGFISETEV